MSELTHAFASALMDRYGDKAFAIAFDQTCDAGTADNLAIWTSIADRISELNRLRVVEILDPQLPSLTQIKPAA